MNNKLKYLVPTAAATSLFLAGCGDDEVTEDACPGSTGTEALLIGSWSLTKEDGESTQGKVFEDDDGDYTYALVYKFECGGDFSIRQVFTYIDDPQNPVSDSYEGAWDFDAADESISIGWTNSYQDKYDWNFEVDMVSESLLKGTLYAEEDTVTQEFERQ